MPNHHLEDISKRFDEKFVGYTPLGGSIRFDVTSLEIKEFTLSEVTAAYERGRADGKESLGLEDAYRKIDEELYFLTQDGYGGNWAETKKEDIKNILAAALTQERIRVEKELKKHLVNDALCSSLYHPKQIICIPHVQTLSVAKYSWVMRMLLLLRISLCVVRAITIRHFSSQCVKAKHS